MARLPTPEHIQAFLDPLTWSGNPFVFRESRRDTKRNYPYKTICWMCGLILLAGSLANLVKYLMDARSHIDTQIMGVDIGTAVVIFVSQIQMWFVIGTAQKHTNKLLMMESNQNTLNGLISLPLTRFQLLLQIMVYPWLASMRLVLLLLPVYVVCVGLDSISWLELTALLIVFALNALNAPWWMRPALSDNLGIVTLAPRTKAGMKAGSAQPPSSTAVGLTALLGSGLSSGFMIQTLITIIGAFNHMRPAQIYLQLEEYLPHSIVSLLPSVYISTPLIMARLLVTPLDWFGIKLPMIIFMLPITLLSRYTILVRASEYLSIGAYIELVKTPTFMGRIQLNYILRWVSLLVISGYLWKWMVVHDGMAILAPAAAKANAGQIGFAVLLFLFVAIYRIQRAGSLGSWQRAEQFRVGGLISRRTTLMGSLRFVMMPFVEIALFYLLCCLLSLTSPFPAFIGGGLFILLSQLTVIGLTGAWFSYGVSRLFGNKGFFPRMFLLMIVAIGVYYRQDLGFQQYIAQTLPAGAIPKLLGQLTQFGIFSPTFGMLHLAAPRSLTTGLWLSNNIEWWRWPLYNTLLGLVCWGLAVGLPVKIAKREEVDTAIVIDPTRVGGEPFLDAVTAKNNPTLKQDTAAGNKFISGFQKIWDNAVTTKELRVRLRGKLEKSMIVTIIFSFLMASILLCMPVVSQFTVVLGGGIATLLYGDHSANPTALLYCSLLGIWYLGFIIFSFGLGTITGNAFHPEVQKSTLIFLLATPMKDRSILIGKLVGMLLPAGLILICIAVWTFLLSLFVIPYVGPVSLLAWIVMMISGLIALLLISTIMMAISSLLPKKSIQTGWIWIVLIYGVAGPLVFAYVVLAVVLSGWGLGTYAPLLAFDMISLAVILVAYFLAKLGLRRMRKSDLERINPARNTS